MRTTENRAQYSRDGLHYPTDLTDAEWTEIKPLIPAARPGGNKHIVDIREVTNGLMFILGTGCQWQAIPRDLPHWWTIYDYMDRWNHDGTLERMHHARYVKCREQAGREPSPTAAVIDSQSVKSAEKDAMGARRGSGTIDAVMQPMESPMSQVDDLSRSLTPFDQDSTLIAVIELSLSSWLVGGIVAGLGHAPLKKLGANEDDVLRLLHRWRDEAMKAGRRITRVVVAFEAGRDGFWLARWLRVRGVEAYAIHAASVAVSRDTSLSKDRSSRYGTAQTRLPRLA